ncbi:MAG: DJ-1/PfpI family protein [Gammaproteobacteria bacterium]
MRRREFLHTTGTVGLGVLPVAAAMSLSSPAIAENASSSRPITNGEPLTPPEKGKIRVAFAIAEGATVIDFAGPWEVFQDVHVMTRGSSMNEMMPFELYTVAATTEPITATGGMRIVPNYSVENAPAPHLVVVPALRGNSALLEWLVAVAPETDVTMSVCTGAFQLAKAGLLDGLHATTHHDFYDSFAEEFPQVKLERGLRFVENPRIATAGGLTSGIDLALHTVERYFGREVAQWTADYMEYTGTRWKA